MRSLRYHSQSSTRQQDSFTFAHAGIYTLGAYAVLALQNLSTPTVVAIPSAVFGTALPGTAVEVIIYRPLRIRGSSRAVLLICSLGMLIVIQNVVSLMFGDATRSLAPSNMGVVEFAGIRATFIQCITILVSIVVACLLYFWLRWTTLGLLLRAVGNDRERGVPTEFTIALAFFVGSALAATAAILSGYDTDLRPMMGFRAVLLGVVAVVVGGVGSLPGAVLGGLFIGFALQFTAWVLPVQWQEAVVAERVFR